MGSARIIERWAHPPVTSRPAETPVDSCSANVRGRDGPSKGAGWPYGSEASREHGDGIHNSVATEVSSQ